MLEQEILDRVKVLSVSGLRHELILGAMIMRELTELKAAINQQTAVMIKLFAPQQQEGAKE